MNLPSTVFLPPRRPSRRHDPVEPPEGGARVPHRWWTTGSLAVVMAALLPLRDLAERHGDDGLHLLGSSRFDTAETVRRIERAAAGHGLFVLTKLRGEWPLIVLASFAGETPVVMETADADPALPLGLLLRPSQSGAEVLVRAVVSPVWEPGRAADRLASLPRVLEQALG